jgi:hypothetical protein
VPFATILRWFIENTNPDTGAPDEAHRGQVLVVSRVAQPGEGRPAWSAMSTRWPMENANTLAREVADTMADGFTCRVDEPQFHGERGALASGPTRVFGN